MKRNTTIEDQLESLKNIELKKKKINGNRKEKLEGFKKLKDDEEVYLFNSEMKTEFEFPKRNLTLIELILYYFDDEFLDLMIEKNIEILANEVTKLPPLF